MSNPTSNYGWQMPTATDLVTDLPADFEVFGQAVDTALMDLKGGTTGQVLKKNTNTDMDFVWGTVAGDIEGVTAGVGITGGGTSGTVTITNDMATTITAAGDIVVGTGSGTYDNLPIGTTAQVLTADTTVSPYKVKWATTAAPAFVGCALTKSASQSAADSTYTAITFDGETFDTDSFHDNVTNNTRITIPAGKGGKYLFVATIDNAANATGIRQAGFWKNGSIAKAQVALSAASAGETKINVSFIIDMVATDYMEVRAYQNSGASRNILDGSIFSCQYLGA
jgi:hypothetical protein